MRAINVEQVLRFFDPKEPLSGQSLRSWFMPRAGSPRTRLKIALIRQYDKPQKVLLIGHRGSGKTTELNKLAEEIQGHFHVIGFNVLDITGRTNLEYEDLMRAISTQVTRNCIEHQLMQSPLAQPLHRQWEELRDWWQQVVSGVEFQPAAAEADVRLQVKALLSQVEVSARQSSLTREAIKEQINLQMPELIQRLNWVIEQAESHGKPRVLIVVEGLDKVDLQSALSIFRDHAPTITAPTCSMIYTFPIALRHTDDYNSIHLSFPEVCFLPNITTQHSDHSTDPDGLSMMRKLVLARMEAALIEDQALQLIVETNGGIPVWLVFLMRSAALYALERDEHATMITTADAQKAIKDLRQNLLTPLTRHDVQVLRERHHDRLLFSDPDEQRLMYNGSLIDYGNGESWCDAHPALWSVLEREDGNANDTQPA
ncbi:MAG: AAA family ATPase [Herpetosiphonaceae bacterium]|nr:AAA family ATPase [Herpetosiphonaceae bacterium]